MDNMNLVQQNSTSIPFFNNGRGNPLRTYVFFGVTLTLDEKYMLLSILHRDASTITFSAVNSATRHQVIIKKFEDLNKNKSAYIAMREVEFACGLVNKNLIELENILLPVRSLSSDKKMVRSDFDEVYLIYKTKGLTYLNSYINVAGEEKNFCDPKWILYKVLKALKYLHDAGVVHRDIQPQNVLVSHDGKEAKLGGFSKCMVIGEKHGNLGELEEKERASSIGSRRLFKYAAPEILIGSFEYLSDPCTDIWAVGCLFADLLYPCSKPLLLLDNDVINPTAQNQIDLLLLVLEPKMEEFEFIQDPDKKSEIRGRYKALLEHQGSLNNEQPSASLLNQLLSFDPSRRISVHQALDHPYFNNMTETAERNDINSQEGCYITEEIEDEDNQLKQAIWETALEFIDSV